MKTITVLLKFSNGDVTEREVDMEAIQDVGVVHDPLTEKNFVFTKTGGRFFSAPIFEETKVLVLDV